MGIKSCLGGEIFCTCPDKLWGSTSFLYSGYWISSPQIKRWRHDVDYPPPSNAKVTGSVELHLLSYHITSYLFTFCRSLHIWNQSQSTPYLGLHGQF